MSVRPCEEKQEKVYVKNRLFIVDARVPFHIDMMRKAVFPAKADKL